MTLLTTPDGRLFICFFLKQYQLAINDYSEAISLKPYDAWVYVLRGGTYNSLAQRQLAIEDFDEAIRLKPDYAEAYSKRGASYVIQDNLNLGCRDAQKACKLGDCKLSEAAKGKGFCR